MPPDHLTPDEIRILTGEIRTDRFEDRVFRYANLPSRNALHSGNAFATRMARDAFKVLKGLDVTTLPFKAVGKTLHNVQAVLPRNGGMTGVIIVSAHLDCTAEAESGYEPEIHPAPGADDDASGIAGVLLVAKALSTLAEKYPDWQRREVRFVLFNAEEERRAGSTAYAEEARMARTLITAVYQMDMIAYAKPGQRPFEINARYAAAEHIQEASVKLARVIERFCPVVSGELTPQVLITPSTVGESDHTSFQDEMYPACVISEDHSTNDGIPGNLNPARHRPTDTHRTLNYTYGADVARAVAAAAWYQATR